MWVYREILPGLFRIEEKTKFSDGTHVRVLSVQSRPCFEFFPANPLPTAEARCLLRAYDDLDTKKTDDWPVDDKNVALWVFTDARDPFRTLFIGNARHVDGRQSLFHARLCGLGRRVQ